MKAMQMNACRELLPCRWRSSVIVPKPQVAVSGHRGTQWAQLQAWAQRGAAGLKKHWRKQSWHETLTPAETAIQKGLKCVRSAARGQAHFPVKLSERFCRSCSDF